MSLFGHDYYTTHLSEAEVRRRLLILMDAVQYAVNRLDHDPRGPQQIQVSGDLAVALAITKANI